MSSSGVKFDWYQTETTVVVEVRIKGCPKDKAMANFSETSCSLRAPIPGKEEQFTLSLRLAHPVVPGECQCRVLSTKIELRLQKREGLRWAGLEGDGSDPLKPAPSASSSSSSFNPSYPSSSGKDWNRIGADIERDFEEDKPEGEAALNEMFRKIYADASDDTKKAMAKSFSESGGTVLSTNWDEIKGQKTEVKPPEGMEYKKWD